MRLPTVMPLYAFEGGGNRTVFSCRSCASRLILACHLVCALISSGINTRYLDLVYAPVKAKLEHLVQRRHACCHPRLNIPRYYGSVYVICIWATATILLIKICHFLHNPEMKHSGGAISTIRSCRTIAAYLHTGKCWPDRYQQPASAVYDLTRQHTTNRYEQYSLLLDTYPLWYTRLDSSLTIHNFQPS